MKLTIVNYHYFREDIYLSGIYPVSKKQFENQLDLISKKYCFVSQKDIIEFLLGSRRLEGKQCCLITWDDGLKEQMSAFETMKRLSVPAIFYAPTYPIFENKVLDVHKIHLIRTKISDDSFYNALNESFKIDSYTFDIDKLDNQYRYDTLISKKVKYFINFVLSENERSKFLDDLFEDLFGDEARFAQSFYMNKDDLIEISKADSLGSHAHRHIPLAKVAAENAKMDILKSINLLEQLTNKPIVSFSYPYGGNSAVSENLVPMFNETNVKFALTMLRGENDLSLENKFLLKRIDTNEAIGGKYYIAEI